MSALTGSAGTAAQRYDYDPYGETTLNPSSGGVANPWRYTSAYQDATGFYKMGMRYYRPELMRWTQQDRLEQPLDPAQAMRYGYAAGNPVNSADQHGTHVLNTAWQYFKRSVVGPITAAYCGVTSAQSASNANAPYKGTLWSIPKAGELFARRYWNCIKLPFMPRVHPGS